MGAPANKPEKAPSRMPKGKNLKCLGCTDGKVITAKGKYRICKGCEGSGYITV